MEKNNQVQIENAEVRHALLEIWRNPFVRPTIEEARSFSEFIKKQCGENIPQDAFGRNKLLHVLKTVSLASAEIGLRGKVMAAYLLWQLCGDALKEIHDTFGADMAQLVQCFIRVEALDVKPEAMQTDNFRNLLDRKSVV